MAKRVIENKPFDEIKVGDTAEVKHTLKQSDIVAFASLTGDINPAHLDVEYAENTIFHGIIAHGMLGGSLISNVLGTKLPGPGTIYMSQTFQFKRPTRAGDTITARVTVREKDEEKKRLILDCVVLNQNDEEVITGEAKVMAPVDKIVRALKPVPEIELVEPHVPLYSKLIQRQAPLPAMITAVVMPVTNVSLMGAIEAKDERIIEPILIGPRAKILELAEKEGIQIGDTTIIDVADEDAAACKAVEMVQDGSVEAIYKGHIHTPNLLRAVLHHKGGISVGRRMSHVFIVEAPTYAKPLFITDAAINIDPKLKEKKDIVQNAIDLFRACGFGTPNVAMLSASEVVDPKMPSTVDADAITKMAESGEITGGNVFGPLALDNAISKSAARTKGINNKVAGDADILVTPNIESGNMLFKQLCFLFDLEAAGLVMGAKVPIILTSRADEASTRLASCALGLLYANRDKIGN